MDLLWGKLKPICMLNGNKIYIWQFFWDHILDRLRSFQSMLLYIYDVSLAYYINLKLRNRDLGNWSPHENSVCAKSGAYYFLGAKKNASNITTRGDLGWCTAFTKLRLFFFSIQDLNEDRLIKIYLILVTNSEHNDCLKIV